MAEITPGQAYGFFTDTSVCIGCKACEVACKQWNQLPGNEPAFGDGFDNTGSLDAQNWRHVQLIDNVPDQTLVAGQGKAWLLMSDVCKHCSHASCMEVCPTDAIIRTEFDTVLHPARVCNGCRNCIRACPYGVIEMDSTTVRAEVHALLRPAPGGLEPACARPARPSPIQFGPVIELRAGPGAGDDLHSQGVPRPAVRRRRLRLRRPERLLPADG
jgi:formate dehydrogenase iron-sulfur subunit